jgi:hypothetical protein
MGGHLGIIGFTWAFKGEKGCDVSVSFLPFVIENISTFEWES